MRLQMLLRCVLIKEIKMHAQPSITFLGTLESIASIKRLHEGVIIIAIVFIITKKRKKHTHTLHTTTHICSMDVCVYTSKKKKK